MKWQRVILLVLLVPIACAEESPVKEGTSTPRAQSDGVYLHSASGLTFPAEIGIFARDEIHHYDDTQTDTSVAYHTVRPDKAILAMVYVYPVRYSNATHEQALSLQLQQIKSEVAQVYGATHFIDDSEYRAGQEIGSVLAFQAERELVTGKGAEPVFSAVYLFEREGWFLKYRATCPVAQKDQVPGELSRLITAIGWPTGT